MTGNVTGDLTPDERQAFEKHPAARNPRKEMLKRVLSHVVLFSVALTMMLPFFWMIFTSLKPLSEVESGHFLPKVWQVHYERDPRHPDRFMRVNNYEEVIASHDKARRIPFPRYYMNSLFIAGWVTLLQVLTSAMAAFAFTRIVWPGRDRVFLLYLATLMIPGVVTLIPNYALFESLHLINTYSGLIIPAAFSAFGTFLLRQFMLGVPLSLDEAAEMDGATRWQIFWDVVMPMARPGLIALAIFTFMGSYQSFFWPLVMVKDEWLRTLPIGLLAYDSTQGRETQLIMAASVMTKAPLVVLFLLGQRYFVEGIRIGGVKG
jgi:ABC-type glycerol-3-phosphate transport system permease component